LADGGVAGSKQRKTDDRERPRHRERHDETVRLRPGGQPFLLAIPEVEVKKPDPPKARARVTVGADEAVIDGVSATELGSVTFGNDQVVFEPADDKSIRLKGLKALNVTSEATTRTVSLQFKSGGSL
jgi:hypothetical protein